MKKKRYQNKKHLMWVAQKPCCLSAHFPALCSANIQAHHLLKPYDGFRGVGLRANDKNVIPLCFKHHNALHKRGNEFAFFEEMTGDELFGQKVAQYLWENSLND
tara:strand:+ start:92 stop:403 length:312 start_codon:yes stop_codon:yes gene_type:complete